MNFDNMAANPTPSSLAEMDARMNQWMADKPSTFNDGTELKLEENDIMLGNFVASGFDGNQFLSVYKSHVFDAISKNGKRFNSTVYCPRASGETELNCPKCTEGMSNQKERMSMWFYVLNIFHATMPKEKQFPQVNWQGKYYFNEEVTGFKIWHSSAWRESPWSDIKKNSEIYNGLHNCLFQLERTGSGTATRYKLYALPNYPGLPPEIYERAKTELESIPVILRKQIGSAVQAAPVQAAQAQGAPVTPFVIPGTPAPTFGFTPQTGAAPQPSAPMFTPAAPVIPQTQPIAEMPSFNLPVQEATTLSELTGTPVEPEEDTKRPMKSMF